MTTPNATDPDAPLRVALAPIAAGADVAANARCVAQAIDQAARAGARILLTPECALVGYPSAGRPDLSSVNRCTLAEAEDQLCLHAERQGLVLALGSAGGAQAWTNDAVVGGAITAQRYRKRSLTPIDTGHFVAGTEPLIITHLGWRLGLAICYDLRFAPVIADLARAGADAFLVIAHMGGVDPDPGVKERIIPQLCAVRAAEWATPLAFCNTGAADRWCESGAWDARGMPLPCDAQGSIHIVELPPRRTHGDWYQRLRSDHLARW